MLRTLVRTLACSTAAAALLTLPPMATDAQAHSGATWGGAQHRHVKGSRICRFRIVKKRVGSLHVPPKVDPPKTKSRTAGPTGGDFVGGTVDVIAAGELIETLSMDTPIDGRVISRGHTTARAGDAVAVTFEAPILDADGQPMGETQPVTFTIEAISAENTELSNDDGWALQARLTPAGKLHVAITHADRNWAGDGLYVIDHQVGDLEARPLRIKEVRQSWVAQITRDLAEYDHLTIATGFTDRFDFELISTVTTVALEDGEVAPGISRATLDADDEGRARLSAWTASTGDVAGLHVQMLDRDTTEFVHDALDAEPQSTQVSFLSGALEFDGGESPAGYIYLVLLDFIDANGEPSGQQHEVEVHVPPTLDPAGYNTVYAPFDDGRGTLAAIHGPDGYHFEIIHEGVEGRDGQSVNIIFEEPFEGPAPLESEVNAPRLVRWDHWVSTADAPLPDLTAVTATVVDAEGAELSVDGFTLSGAGRTGRDATSKQGYVTEMHEGATVRVYTHSVAERRVQAPAELAP